jgi:hypothetical protein
MNVTTHPSLETLAAYCETPDAVDYAALRRHLAQCGACRDRIDALNRVTDAVATGQLTDIDRRADDALEQQVPAWIDGALPPRESSEMAASMARDPRALKAALHYATHGAAMRRRLPVASKPALQSAPPTAANKHAPAGSQRIAAWFAVRMPVWAGAAATAAIALVLAALLQQPASDVGNVVAAYQDEPVLTFSVADAPPGIGFFDQARQRTEAFGGMTVELRAADTLSLRWPPVAQAAEYRVTIQRVDDAGASTVAEATSREARVEISGHVWQRGRRYEWTLSGTTSSGQRFVTRGGFVIARS